MTSITSISQSDHFVNETSWMLLFSSGTPHGFILSSSCESTQRTSLQIHHLASASKLPLTQNSSHNTYKRALNFDSSSSRSSILQYHKTERGKGNCSKHQTPRITETFYLMKTNHGPRKWLLTFQFTLHPVVVRVNIPSPGIKPLQGSHRATVSIHSTGI